MTGTAPALFDRLADRCDQVVPFFAGFAGQLLDVLAPDPGTRLLDIGSGRGAVAAARGCAVTAADAAPRMVSLLAAGHPGIDARLMDARRLDLPAASYDVAAGASSSTWSPSRRGYSPGCAASCGQAGASR